MQTVYSLRYADVHAVPFKPDYFFSTAGATVGINSSFAYDHGYDSPNIDVTWAAMAGPGVAVRGLDGPQPADGNQAIGPELDPHGAAGQHGRHLGRGDRPAADLALAGGAAATTTRPTATSSRRRWRIHRLR